MMVLQEADRRRLFQILAVHPFLQEEALRRALLINAGLKHLLESVPPQENASVFLHLLFAELLTNLDADQHGEPWLISLLVYVMNSPGDRDLSAEDRQFLQQVVQRSSELPFAGWEEFTRPSTRSLQALASEDKGEAQQRYLRQVIRRNEFIDITGLPSGIVHQSVPLDEVFIPMRLRPNRPLTEYPLTVSELQEYEHRLKNQLPVKDLARFIFDAERSWYAKTKADKTIGIDECWQMLTPERPAATIQGYPGMGKSTLVKYFTLFMARRCLRQHNRSMAIRLAPVLVPYVVRLEDYAARRNDDPDLSLADYLKYVLDRRFNIPDPSPFLQECLNTGKSLVLLDGLDEVSDPRMRLAIQDEIKDFVLMYSDTVEKPYFNRFLVTTRVAGYDQAAFPQYLHFTIAELTGEQIENFLPRWCQAIVRMDTAFMADGQGEQTQAFQREVRRRTEELRTSIRERQELQALVENPLLLTLLAVMQQNNVEVPKQRVELYRLFIQTLLRRRGKNAELSLPSEEQIVLHLGPVAWRMQETGNGFAHKNEVMASLAQTLEQEERNTEADIRPKAEAFLHKVRVQIGLFVFRAGDYYGFLHRTFQEYLAARYELERMMSNPGEIPEFIRRAYNNYVSWREPFLLAVAYASKHQQNLAHEIIRTLLLMPLKKDQESQNLCIRMAVECLIEAEPFAIDTRFERYIAERLLHTYEKAQRHRRFESCQQIEDVMRRWLLSLPHKETGAPILIVLREALSSHERPAYQRATLTLLVMLIEQIVPQTPVILSALFPSLLALASLPPIGDYRPVSGFAAASDLAVADLALTVLSLSGIHGPAGVLVESVRNHFDNHPEQLRFLAQYSLESRVLLTPTVIPKKDEGNEEWPGDISLRRWRLLLERHHSIPATEQELLSCISIHRELLRSAEEMRYPLTLHLLNILTEVQKTVGQPWKDACLYYLSSQLNAGSYISYQECALFWCTLFPDQQDLQRLVSLLIAHLERDGQPVQQYAQRFLATLTDSLLALDDLQAIGYADLPEGQFLQYLRYWLDIREIRSMQDPREVRYLRFLRDMHTLQNLRLFQGEEPLQHPSYLQDLQYTLFTHERTKKVITCISATSSDQDEYNDLLTILLGRVFSIQSGHEKGDAIEQELQQIVQAICTQAAFIESGEQSDIVLDIIRYLPVSSTKGRDYLVQLAEAAGSEEIREACLSTLSKAFSQTADALIEVRARLPQIRALESGGGSAEEADDIPQFLLEPYEHGALSIRMYERSGKKQIAKANGPSSFDVCIICALAEEARAFLRVLTRQYNVQFEQGYSKLNRYEYRHATIKNNKGEPLNIHVSWPPGYGPIEAGLHLKSVLEECRPRFASMTGICAGDKKAVHLGDIIVAERAFTYDNGKFETDEDGRKVYSHDTITFQPKPEVLQFGRMFDQWESATAHIPRLRSKRQQREWLLNTLLDTATRVDEIEEKDLRKYAPQWRRIVDELQEGITPYLTQGWTLVDLDHVQRLRRGKEPFPYKDPPRPLCHIKPIASGGAVRADNPFSSVQIPVRGAVAIDMEGAAFYRTLTNFPAIHALLVKGVSDYADGDKDDTYHGYAASVSAAYILAFIKEYVTKERLPVAE